jgi:hypothetical protein
MQCLQCGSVSSTKQRETCSLLVRFLLIHRYRRNCLTQRGASLGRRTRRSNVVSIDVTWYGPVWSVGQSTWLQNLRFRVRFAPQQGFLKSDECGTGSTQSREDKWGATWKNRQRLQSGNTQWLAVRDIYQHSGRRLSAKLVRIFLRIQGCHVVSATDPHNP